MKILMLNYPIGGFHEIHTKLNSAEILRDETLLGTYLKNNIQLMKANVDIDE